MLIFRLNVSFTYCSNASVCWLLVNLHKNISEKYDASCAFSATPELASCFLLFFCLMFDSVSQLLCVLVAYGPWQDHVADFWDHRRDGNVLFLFYEDLHQVVHLRCDFF